jgi:hypothetical protein
MDYFNTKMHDLNVSFRANYRTLWRSLSGAHFSKHRHQVQTVIFVQRSVVLRSPTEYNIKNLLSLKTRRGFRSKSGLPQIEPLQHMVSVTGI